MACNSSIVCAQHDAYSPFPKHFKIRIYLIRFKLVLYLTFIRLHLPFRKLWDKNKKATNQQRHVHMQFNFRLIYQIKERKNDTHTYSVSFCHNKFFVSQSL